MDRYHIALFMYILTLIATALGIVALGIAIGTVAGARQLPTRMAGVNAPPAGSVLS